MAMTTQDVRDKAEAIRQVAAQDAQRIGNRTDLTSLARQQRLAKSYLASRAQMAALQQTATADTSARIAELKRKLFGVSDLPGDAATNAVSSRDALDRVAGMTDPADAMRLLDRANSVGDEVLARAVACYAFEQVGQLDGPFGSNWLPILQKYVDGQSDVRGKAMDELLNLTASSRNPIEIFAFVLTPPSELSGVGESTLQQLASS